MSAIAGGHVHVRPRGMTLAVSADTVAITALAVLTAVLVALTWGAWGDFGRDTGYDVVAGARVAHGDLPYRDFTYYYGRSPRSRSDSQPGSAAAD
jgi:hypothetical protein